jgi:hypothetical protein
MEALAGYHSRGRRFQPLTDAALKRRWLKCLRREFNAARFSRTEMDDISAELSLRGIVNVKLPPDLIELMTADIRKSHVPTALIRVPRLDQNADRGTVETSRIHR